MLVTLYACNQVMTTDRNRLYADDDDDVTMTSFTSASHSVAALSCAATDGSFFVTDHVTFYVSLLGGKCSENLEENDELRYCKVQTQTYMYCF